MLKIYFGGVVTVVAVILIPKVYSQDADTSFKNEDDFDYDQSFRNPGFTPDVRRNQEYQFKTFDITNLNQELRNGTADLTNRKLPVSIYIYGGKFLQITNLRNKDAWSTLPFNDENLRQIGILFNAKILEVTTSTLRAASIPSSLSKLNVSHTKIIEGSLADVLKKCDQLEEISINRSGDISISDLPTQNLKLLEMTGVSLIYAPNVKLPNVRLIRLYRDMFVDPRIVREFDRIFSNLESISLDQTHYGLLKSSLREIPSLNWINVWKLNPILLKDDTEWDGLLIQAVSRVKNSTADSIFTLVREGKWKYFKYS